MIAAMLVFLLADVTILSAFFCALYARRSNWRATAPGRSLMYLNLAILGLAFNEFAARLPLDFAVHGLVRVVLLAILVAALTKQLVTLHHAQSSQ